MVPGNTQVRRKWVKLSHRFRWIFWAIDSVLPEGQSNVRPLRNLSSSTGQSVSLSDRTVTLSYRGPVRISLGPRPLSIWGRPVYHSGRSWSGRSRKGIPRSVTTRLVSLPGEEPKSFFFPTLPLPLSLALSPAHWDFHHASSAASRVSGFPDPLCIEAFYNGDRESARKRGIIYVLRSPDHPF